MTCRSDLPTSQNELCAYERGRFFSLPWSQRKRALVIKLDSRREVKRRGEDAERLLGIGAAGHNEICLGIENRGG